MSIARRAAGPCWKRARATSEATRSSERDRKSTRLNSSHTVIYTLSLHDALPILSYSAEKSLDVDRSPCRRTLLEESARDFRSDSFERKRRRNALPRVLQRALLQPSVIERETDLVELRARLLQRRARLFRERDELVADRSKSVRERLLRGAARIASGQSAREQRRDAQPAAPLVAVAVEQEMRAYRPLRFDQSRQ